MDIDALRHCYAGHWHRLAVLVKRRRLSVAEADEFLALYSLSQNHYEQIRYLNPWAPEVAYLDNLLHRAAMTMNKPARYSLRSVRSVLWHQAPLAIRRVLPLSLVVFSAFILGGFVFGEWLLSSGAVDSAHSSTHQQRYASQEFLAYYSQYPPADFAARVITNNSWIAAVAVASGITGVAPFFIVIVNFLNVGNSGAIMHNQDSSAEFWLAILPHGVPEIAGLCIAAAAGIRVFSGWLMPGQRRRIHMVQQRGSEALFVLVAVLILLFLSGLIEAFITPSDMPDVLRLGSGIVLLSAFVLSVLVLSSRTVRAGPEGDGAGYRTVALYSVGKPAAPIIKTDDKK